MNISIRPFDYEKDVKGVLEVFDANTPKYFNPHERDWFESYLKTEIEDFFVVENENFIIGAGGLNYEKEWAVLSWGFIHPSHHGKGIGTIMTKHRIQHLLSTQKYSTLVVRTSQLTEGFYSKMGFHVVERKTNYWGGGMDLVFMKMELGDWVTR